MKYTSQDIPFLQSMMCAAPPVPAWFEPIMPPRPEVPDYGKMSRKAVAVWRCMVGGENFGPEDVPPLGTPFRDCDPVAGTWTLDDATREEVVMYATKRRQIFEEYEAWKAEREKQRLFQWPLAYAEGTLATVLERFKK